VERLKRCLENYFKYQLLCPSILETLSIGNPFVKVTVVANVCQTN
jgi:hypothetical protein